MSDIEDRAMTTPTPREAPDPRIDELAREMFSLAGDPTSPENRADASRVLGRLDALAHARATGHDRGRELAEIAERVERAVERHGTHVRELPERDDQGRYRTMLRDEIGDVPDALRALAAPAETEVQRAAERAAYPLRVAAAWPEAEGEAGKLLVQANDLTGLLLEGIHAADWDKVRTVHLMLSKAVLAAPAEAPAACVCPPGVCLGESVPHGGPVTCQACARQDPEADCLAAPEAETEAGDVDLSDEVAVVERMLRHADLSTREVDAVRAVVVQATESTKWVDEGETRWDMAEALGFELVEDAPPWRDLRDAARLAAAPPAQGEAETEGLDPHRLGEALDYAWTQWIGDVGHVPDAFHLHPRTARCSATFEGSEFARQAAGRYDHLARLAATPPSPSGEGGGGGRLVRPRQARPQPYYPDLPPAPAGPAQAEKQQDV